MTISAEIFKKISYVYYPQARSREGFLMLPAFPVDSSNKKRIQTAKEWAERHFQSKVYLDGKYVDNPELRKEIVIEEYDNEPISGVKIVDLEVRGNGGRAYKIALPNKLFVDMREDVLMETIMKRGVSPGGVLNGEFIWCRVSSETKLVLVGSELHKQCLEAMKFRGNDLIKKNFEVGKLYQSKDHYILYCGEVFCSTTNGNVVKRDAWIQTSGSVSLRLAVKAFSKAIENNHVEKFNHYDYANKSYVTGQAGKMPNVRPIDGDVELPEFTGLNKFIPSIVKEFREQHLTSYVNRVSCYQQYREWTPEKQKAKDRESGKYSNYYYYGYYDRNPHEYDNKDRLVRQVEDSFMYLTLGINKESCKPDREDLKNYILLSKETEKWEPDFKNA